MTIARTVGSDLVPAEEAAMAEQSFDSDAYIVAAAALVGLPLDAEYQPGVALNLQRIAEMAALIMEFPLPDEAEPAPVFTP